VKVFSGFEVYCGGSGLGVFLWWLWLGGLLWWLWLGGLDCCTYFTVVDSGLALGFTELTLVKVILIYILYI